MAGLGTSAAMGVANIVNVRLTCFDVLLKKPKKV